MNNDDEDFRVHVAYRQVDFAQQEEMKRIEGLIEQHRHRQEEHRANAEKEALDNQIEFNTKKAKMEERFSISLLTGVQSFFKTNHQKAFRLHHLMSTMDTGGRFDRMLVKLSLYIEGLNLIKNLKVTISEDDQERIDIHKSIGVPIAQSLLTELALIDENGKKIFPRLPTPGEQRELMEKYHQIEFTVESVINFIAFDPSKETGGIAQ